MAATPADDLRERVALYLRAHHTMTIATVGRRAAAEPLDSPAASPPSPGSALPHAASVFYAVDTKMRLVFLSKATSTHGVQIGAAAPVAITVTEQYDDWQQIQGVQLWGEVRRLGGSAKAGAMAVYLQRFPFVKETMERPRLAEALRGVAVYRVEPERVAFTDNTTGVFGREVLDMKG